MLTLIDVSSYQPAIDWHRLRAAGIDGAYVKATEGTGYVNPRMHEQASGARAAGIRVGFYHFAHPEHSQAAVEAHHFARTIGKPGRRDLRPVLDLEVGEPRAAEAWARSFNHEVRGRLGMFPILYSYSAYLTTMHAGKPIGAGLWLASYGRNDGHDHGADVPPPWRKFIAHQFTSQGHVTGVNGEVDLSHAPKLGPLLAHPFVGRL